MAIINLSIVQKNVWRNDDIITCLSVLVSKIVKKPLGASEFGDFFTSRSGLLGPPFSSRVGILPYPFFICFMNILGTLVSGCSYTTNSFLFSQGSVIPDVWHIQDNTTIFCFFDTSRISFN